MLGSQPCLPVDVMYRPIEKPLQSYGEYAKLLQHRLQATFDLVKQHVTTEHLHQREFYDQKYVYLYGKLQNGRPNLVTFTSSKARLMS